MMSRPATLAVLLLSTAATCGPALAQMPGGGHGYSGGIAPPPGASKDAKPAPLPPAVPGARTADAPAAAANRLPSDMSPNDALFDAINRGDLAGARDALNRGALLSAQNVLGMTPLDLSVDLGRDDITFLLLSMRGSDPAPPGSKRDVAAAAPPPPPRPAAKHGPAPRVQAAAKVARVQPAPAPKAPPPLRYAQDGGTPNPSAGFLGFNGR